MARPRSAIRKVRWLVSVDEPIANRIDLLLVDPMSGRSTYGARSALINRLLAEYLNEQFAEETADENP